MTVPERIASILSPHLGAQSSDVVARHLCAKYGVDESVTAEQAAQLVEFLRRGLVAYVGTDKAAELAQKCGASIAPA
jgi:hypothetical protein